VYGKWGFPSGNPVSNPIQSKKRIHFSSKSRSTQERVEAVIHQIVTNRIDITQDEPDWFRLACALANTFGEAGREYFHAISQFHPDYQSSNADRKYDHALKAGYGNISIGTFFALTAP
jgi:hypothetical protein